MKVYFLIYSSSSRWLQGEEWRYNNSEMRAYQHTSMWHNTIIPLRNAADMSERWILNKLPYLQYHSHYKNLFFAFFYISFSCFPSREKQNNAQSLYFGYHSLVATLMRETLTSKCLFCCSSLDFSSCLLVVCLKKLKIYLIFLIHYLFYFNTNFTILKNLVFVTYCVAKESFGPKQFEVGWDLANFCADFSLLVNHTLLGGSGMVLLAQGNVANYERIGWGSIIDNSTSKDFPCHPIFLI